MLSFSQRIGKKPAVKFLQLETLDEGTRARIWSCIWDGILSKQSYSTLYGERESEVSKQMLFLKMIWAHHLKLPIDSMPEWSSTSQKSCYGRMRSCVLEGEWYNAFDLIESIIGFAPEGWGKHLIKYLNVILQVENVGYRIIEREFVPISDETEVATIQEAATSKQNSARKHIGRALELLSDRAAPDYRNSIKESISAVEASCKQISGGSGGVLNEALRKIKKNHHLHPAFEQALLKLYSFTSDEGGIRHSLTEDTVEPTFADAKFMLVACCAFTNYLVTLTAEGEK